MLTLFSGRLNMPALGRKLDPIRGEAAPNKARCRQCHYECAPLVGRMWKHFIKSHEALGSVQTSTPLTPTGPTALKQLRITQYAISTNPPAKAKFDKDILISTGFVHSDLRNRLAPEKSENVRFFFVSLIQIVLIYFHLKYFHLRYCLKRLCCCLKWLCYCLKHKIYCILFFK